MKVLELFSGTRSVGTCCDALGWDSVSVDMILPADHQVDIMKFDYKQYPKDYFDIVWASPPCTEYSSLKKCWFGCKLLFFLCLHLFGCILSIVIFFKVFWLWIMVFIAQRCKHDMF